MAHGAKALGMGRGCPRARTPPPPLSSYSATAGSPWAQLKEEVGPSGGPWPCLRGGTCLRGRGGMWSLPQGSWVGAQACPQAHWVSADAQGLCCDAQGEHGPLVSYNVSLTPLQLAPNGHAVMGTAQKGPERGPKMLCACASAQGCTVLCSAGPCQPSGGREPPCADAQGTWIHADWLPSRRYHSP